MSVLVFDAALSDFIVPGMHARSLRQFAGVCALLFVVGALQVLCARLSVRTSERDLAAARRQQRRQFMPSWQSALVLPLSTLLSALLASLLMLALMTFNFWVIVTCALGTTAGVFIDHAHQRWNVRSAVDSRSNADPSRNHKPDETDETDALLDFASSRAQPAKVQAVHDHDASAQ